MRTSASIVVLEPPTSTNRRQPLRQTRTNPTRHGTNAPRQTGRWGSHSPDDALPAEGTIGFYPAITHFSDAIVALPKEMIRHSTMLKEVDAKIYNPEEALKRVVTDLLAIAPETRRRGEAIEHYNDDVLETASTSKDDQSRLMEPDGAIRQVHQFNAGADFQRRERFVRLQLSLRDILPTLDEKIHVLTTANDALEKQIGRCQGSFREIDNEISEITRHGSLSHWAYNDKSMEKKGTTAGERTRREAAIAQAAAVAAALANGEADTGSKRDNMTTRKQRNHLPLAGDSDFDVDRPLKRPAGAAKGRKPADVTSAPTSNLTMPNGHASNNGNKRRKIEKPSTTGIGGVTMERSLSGVFGSQRGRGGSPHDSTVADGKKRGRGGSAMANGNARKRSVTQRRDEAQLILNRNTSAAHSPSMASSPVVGTFSASMRGGNSPALGTMQRTLSSRARQNSLQDKPKSATIVPSKERNGATNTPNEPEKRPQASLKVTTEVPKIKGEEAPSVEVDTRTSSRSNDRSAGRREESSAAAAPPSRPPSISTSSRVGKASKTSTPVTASFPESTVRVRPGRFGNNPNPPDTAPVKRSHKKGAGLAAQMAALQRSKEKEGSGESLGGDAADDDEDEAAEEKRYCYCNGVSYGEMVACDYEGCQKEWFHLECANLARAPTGKGEYSDHPHSSPLLVIRLTERKQNGTVKIARRSSRVCEEGCRAYCDLWLS